MFLVNVTSLQDKNILTLCSPKVITRISITFTKQRHSQIVTSDLRWLEIASQDAALPDSHPNGELHVHDVSPGARQRGVSAPEDGAEHRGVLPALVKRRRGGQIHRGERLRLVARGDLDAVEEHAALAVRVSEGQGEGEAVGERVVFGGCDGGEWREGGVGDGDFELPRLVDEDDDQESDDGDEDGDGDDAEPP